VEAIEDVRQVLLVESGAVVANAHRGSALCHLDRPADWAPLARVVKQVGDRSRDPVGVAAHDRRLNRTLHRQLGRPSSCPIGE
jgi:hypothetical protein